MVKFRSGIRQSGTFFVLDSNYIFFGTLCVESLSGISNYMMSKCSLKYKMPPFKVPIVVFAVSSGLNYKRSDSVNSALY